MVILEGLHIFDIESKWKLCFMEIEIVAFVHEIKASWRPSKSFHPPSLLHVKHIETGCQQQQYPWYPGRNLCYRISSSFHLPFDQKFLRSSFNTWYITSPLLLFLLSRIILLFPTGISGKTLSKDQLYQYVIF